LIGSLLVGSQFAKSLALALNKPLISVHHMQAHVLANLIADPKPGFPFLCLTVSGGHTQIVLCDSPIQMKVIGETIDDAAGEAFDKSAKLLGLPYPGGPEIERLARAGHAKRFSLPRPMMGREGSDFSFCGLKTAVRQMVRGKTPLIDQDKADLAASFQSAVVDVLKDRARAAMQQFRASFGNMRERPSLVAAGGVAANGPIRQGLASLAAEEGFVLSLAPPALCTDNGAMVAWAGLERLALGVSDALDAAPRARWPLESQDNQVRVARTGH
jgi:N6-L-threonylcarbamoyladenine synthase